MKKTTTETAPAKINLTLDVTEKRADGFHNIKSIMHSLSLCDLLTLSAERADKTEVTLEIIGNRSLPTDRNNLVVKAVYTYLERIGESAIVEASLTKSIPAAAGLGGGSSDAAATLRAMNRLYNGRLSCEELISLAAALGSDVPYCLVGGTALCEGRGEIMTKINTSAKGVFVVAKGDDTVSTPRAYAELDRIYSDFAAANSVGTVKNEKMLASLSEGIISPLYLYNIFEDAAIPTCPSVAKIKELMSVSGALGTLMSGSGPSVFGMFETKEKALNAEKKLRAEGYCAFVAESI